MLILIQTQGWNLALPAAFFLYSLTIVSYLALVAEVTQPSLGVGYEIGRAIENKKKILCLFRPDSGKCKLILFLF